MQNLLKSSRYVALCGVVALLVAAIGAFGWGVLKALQVVQKVFVSYGQDPQLIIGFVQLLDVFLIAAALFIFAVSLYVLFIGPLDLPSWMVAHNLYELKAKLSSIMILVMAVKFVEKFMLWQDPQGTLLFGLAVAVVSVALIGLTYATQKDGKD